MHSYISFTLGEIIRIGSKYDYTDERFRDVIPIFDSKPMFMIEPKSDKNEIHMGGVYWISPNDNVIKRGYFKINTTINHKLIEFPHDKMNNGLWTVVYNDFRKQINLLNFLMVGNQDIVKETEVELNSLEINVLKSIKSAKMDTDSWIKSTFVLQDSCITGQSCELTNWSSKSHDPFSTFKL